MAADATEGAHCGYLAPVFVPDACTTPAASPERILLAGSTFDTNDDASCDGGIILQATGPELCVVRHRVITVAGPGTVRVTGGRALVLVADTELRVDGLLDVSADGTLGGPGASGVSGTLAGSAGGGGGAGGQFSGGSGGSTDAGFGGAGGAAVDRSMATVLFGGARPAFTSPTPTFSSVSGGGGGAVMLVACRGLVLVAGDIDAGGGRAQGGGDASLTATLSLRGGPGGGAGGYVAIAGASVVISGRLYANGGAGGGGTDLNNSVGLVGGDGQRSTLPALGGNANGTGGRGGNGGALGVGAQGGAGGSVAGAGGGGGGAVGTFHVFTPAGVVPALTPLEASPAISPPLTVPTR